MAVSQEFLLKTNLVKREINGYRVEFDFTLAAITLMDASGGSTSTYYDLGNINDNVYYCITSLSYMSVVNTHDCCCRTGLGSWENLYIPTISHCYYILSTFDDLDAQYGAHTNRTPNIYYLGKPANHDSMGLGRIIYYILANVNGDSQRSVIQGYALKDPLPLTTIFRPNPLYTPNPSLYKPPSRRRRGNNIKHNS